MDRRVLNPDLLADWADADPSLLHDQRIIKLNKYLIQLLNLKQLYSGSEKFDTIVEFGQPPKTGLGYRSLSIRRRLRPNARMELEPSEYALHLDYAQHFTQKVESSFLELTAPGPISDIAKKFIQTSCPQDSEVIIKEFEEKNYVIFWLSSSPVEKRKTPAAIYMNLHATVSAGVIQDDLEKKLIQYLDSITP